GRLRRWESHGCSVVPPSTRTRRRRIGVARPARAARPRLRARGSHGRFEGNAVGAARAATPYARAHERLTREESLEEIGDTVDSYSAEPEHAGKVMKRNRLPTLHNPLRGRPALGGHEINGWDQWRRRRDKILLQDLRQHPVPRPVGTNGATSCRLCPRVLSRNGPHEAERSRGGASSEASPRRYRAAGRPACWARCPPVGSTKPSALVTLR